MKLTLFCDENVNAASEDALRRVLKNKDKENIIVITPENSTLWAEEFLASNSKNGAISGLEITNISRLCQRIYPSVKFASTELSSMLVARSMQINDLLAYRNSAKRFGVASEIYNVIKLFSGSGIDPSVLLPKNKNKILDQKLSDIKTIWETYIKILPVGTYDGNSKIKIIQNAVNLGYFAGKTVYFVGFDDVSESMLKLVESVCSSAKEIVASVVEEDNQKIVNSSVANEFLAVAERQNLEVVFERKNNLEKRSCHIAKNLYAKNRQSIETDGIRVVKCFNRRNESEMVSIFIANKIRAGEKYKNFEIIVPNIEQYEKYLAPELRNYDIPFFADSAKSIEQYALTKLVDSYLVALSNQSKVQDLISLNKNILLGFDLNKLFEYENFCKKFGIEFSDFSAPLSVGMLDSNFAVANEVHNIIRQQTSDMPAVGSCAGEVVSSVRKFLADNNIEKALLDLQVKQHDTEEKEISERIFEKVNDLLDEIDSALGTEKLSFSQILEIWRSGVKATKLKLIPPTLDSVRICDVSTSKHRSVKNLIIMGACESDFPAFVVDNGILTDAELLQIDQEYKLKIRPTVEHVNELEKFKVLELLSLSDGDIFVTFPDRVGADQQCESMCINALRGICLRNGAPIEIESSTPKNSLQMRQYLLSKSLSVLGAEQVFAMGKSKGKNRQSTLASADVYGSVEKALSLTVKRQKTSIDKDKKLSVNPFFVGGKTSISELESYFSCPYMHFARYGLGVKESENASIKALDIGNFLHLCLEKITNKFKENNCQMTDQEFSKQMKAILTEIVKNEKYQAKVNALQLEALKNEACRLCYAVLKGFDNTTFRPVFAELSFGKTKGSALPAVSFDGTKVVLEGKIDRMDVSGDMVRLVDYKTGTIDLGIDNLYYGKKVQLFAYLLSVIEDGKYKPAGVFYLPIRSVFRKNSNMLESYKLQGYFSGADEVVFALDNTLDFDNPKSSLVEATISTSKENKMLGKKVLKNQMHILKDNELEKLAKYAKNLMSGAIREIENGEIAISPLDKSGSRACDYCPFRAACKIDENPQNIRHEKEKIEIEQLFGEE